MILNSKYNFLKPFKVKKLVRLGRNYDGGYLLCDEILQSCEHLITLGVGDDVSFEIDFEKKKNFKTIKMYDYTVNNFLFIKNIFKYFRRLITFRTKLDNFKNSIKNYLNFFIFLRKENIFLEKLRIVNKVKFSYDITLNSILKNTNNKKNLLKIDIEGSEYEVIDHIINHHFKIKMLVIEFHWINKNKNLFIKSVKKLKKFFDIIHIHPNNYKPMKNSDDIFDVLELTLVHKNANKYRKNYRESFPIKNLDFECFPHHKKIFFSFKK